MISFPIESVYLCPFLYNAIIYSTITCLIFLSYHIPANSNPMNRMTPPAISVPIPLSAPSGVGVGGAFEYCTPPAINSARPVQINKSIIIRVRKYKRLDSFLLLYVTPLQQWRLMMIMNYPAFLQIFG